MDEEPKFGLMVSLVLMNITAVALFFLAAPAPKKSSDVENSQRIQLNQVEMVMAGDVEKKVVEDKAVLLTSADGAELGSVCASQLKMDKRDLRYSTHGPESIRGNVDMRVTRPRNEGPPLATVLREFVRNSKSCMIRLFEGLRNGYMQKRLGAVKDTGASKSDGAELENVDLLELSAPEPQEFTDSWMWGPWEDVSQVNQDTVIATEIVMDALSKTQRRTAELIEVFSKKVVPAIDRMNGRVAEAIRLEKNLDSYTSTLISAIDSVICPMENEINPPKKNQPGKNRVRKLKFTKPFRSDQNSVQDPQLLDYVRNLSKGEHSKHATRPVYNTLAARCLHYRHKKNSCKTKRCNRSCKKEIVLRSIGDQLLHSEHKALGINDKPLKCLTEPTYPFSIENDCGNYVDPEEEKYSRDPTDQCISKGLLKNGKIPHERTIGIEDVLALTSSFEQSHDHEMQASDMDFKSVQSGLTSEFSISSGMEIRSPFTVETAEQGSTCAQVEEKPSGAFSVMVLNKSPVSTVMRLPEPTEHLAEQAEQHVGTLTSECSIVCDSRIQGYDSYLARRESSTIAQHFPGSEPRTVSKDLKTGESNHSISVPGNKNNTNDLVNIFKRLDLHEKEVAMENVCLLVLRIFEAWSESQQPISPLGISRISLSSWSSKDEVSLGQNRPRTAIFRSTNIESVQEHQCTMESSFARKSTSEYFVTDEHPPNLFTISKYDVLSTEISRSLVQSAVDAAEVRVAEKSLKDLKTNILRSQPMKSDELYLDSPDVVNASGFGDMQENPLTAVENETVVLVSKSHDSIIEASKESSSATFYTGQPESSEDAFYECISTISAGTYGSLELEDSSKLFLERIQEEEAKVHRGKFSPEGKAVAEHPQTAHSSFSIESWLNDSGEELPVTHEDVKSQEFSDNSSIDVGCGTDDETYLCNSLDSSPDESGVDANQKEKKKKKWGAKLLKKFLKKKTKPPSSPMITSNGSQSDSAVLKLIDQNSANCVDEQAQ